MRRKLWMISLVLVVTFGTLPACGGDGDEEDQEDDDDDRRKRAPQVALMQHARYVPATGPVKPSLRL